MAEFKVPELGENVAGGDVTRVLVKVGDTIAAIRPVLELETDKATIEVPSSVAGRVTEIKVKKGDKIKVGAVVLVVEDGASGEASPKAQRLDVTRPATRRQKPRVPESETPKAEAPKDKVVSMPARPGGRVEACASRGRLSTPRQVPNLQSPSPKAPASGEGDAEDTGGTGRAVRQAAGARSWRRHQRGPGIRPGRTDLGGGRQGTRAPDPEQHASWRAPPRPRAPARRHGRRSAAGLLEVGRDRAAADEQHPAHDGGAPQPRLEHHPARHAVRQGRHHRHGGAAQEVPRAGRRRRAATSR